MFEIFIQERLQGVDQSGFEKKMNEMKLQAEAAKKAFGIDEFDGGSSTLRKKRFKPNKTSTWGTLRKFKRDTQTCEATTIIGSPTLVKATTERMDGAKVAPQVPPKIISIPGFDVPTKPLPKAPCGARPVFKTATSSISLGTSSNPRHSKSIPPNSNAPRQRNTWKPQTKPVDFARQVNAAGENPVPPHRPPRARRPLPSRPRPESVRPAITTPNIQQTK